MSHPLVCVAREIDWPFLKLRLGEVYKALDGHPPLPTGWRGATDSQTHALTVGRAAVRTQG